MHQASELQFSEQHDTQLKVTGDISYCLATERQAFHFSDSATDCLPALFTCCTMWNSSHAQSSSRTSQSEKIAGMGVIIGTVTYNRPFFQSYRAN